MSRGLTASALAVTGAEILSRTIAVELQFPGGIVRWNGTPKTLTFNGADFLGIGALGSITAIEEGAELRAYGLTLQVSAIPRDMVSIALNQQYQGRKATVWEVPIDANGEVVANPFIVFRGRMDQMDIILGTTATVVIKLENRLADWERPRVQRYTDEDQRARYPNDAGFRFVSATTEKELVWPERGFFSR